MHVNGATMDAPTRDYAEMDQNRKSAARHHAEMSNVRHGAVGSVKCGYGRFSPEAEAFAAQTRYEVLTSAIGQLRPYGVLPWSGGLMCGNGP